MRAALLLLAVLAAVAGVWLLWGGEGEPLRELPDGDVSTGAGDEPSSAGTHNREIADAAVVGVVGQQDGVQLRPVDYDKVLGQMLEFPASAEGVDGAGWLQAVEKRYGRRLPVRFLDAESLKTFRGLQLLAEPPPKSVDLPATLEWLREQGYVGEQMSTCLLIRRNP